MFVFKIPLTRTAKGQAIISKIKLFFSINTWHKNTKVIAGVICISKGSVHLIKNLNGLSLQAIVFWLMNYSWTSLLIAGRILRRVYSSKYSISKTKVVAHLFVWHSVNTCLSGVTWATVTSDFADLLYGWWKKFRASYMIEKSMQFEHTEPRKYNANHPQAKQHPNAHKNHSTLVTFALFGFGSKTN